MALEIEESGFTRLRRGGWPYFKALAVVSLVFGGALAAFVTVLTGLSPAHGWDRIPQSWEIIVGGFLVGVIITFLSAIVKMRWLSLKEDGIVLKERITTRKVSSKEYSPNAVRELAIHCWQKRHLNIGVRWHAILEVRWINPETPSLNICGLATGVEEATEWLAEIYPVAKQEIDALRPGHNFDKEREEKERTEISKLQEMGRHRFCLCYGVLPVGIPMAIGYTLLMGFVYSWSSVLAMAVMSALIFPALGYLAGWFFWRWMKQRAEELEQDDPS